MVEKNTSSQPACPGCQEAPLFDASRCDGCGLCAAACPCQAVTMTPQGPAFACGTRCDAVQHCVALSYGFFPCESACPQGAIQARFTIVPG